MDDFKMQRQHFDEAHTHVQEGRERVRQQIGMIRGFRTDGRDTSEAFQLLIALRQAAAAGRQ